MGRSAIVNEVTIRDGVRGALADTIGLARASAHVHQNSIYIHNKTGTNLPRTDCRVRPDQLLHPSIGLLRPALLDVQP